MKKKLRTTFPITILPITKATKPKRLLDVVGKVRR